MKPVFLILAIFFGCSAPPEYKQAQPAVTGKMLPATFEGGVAIHDLSERAKYGSTLRIVIDRADSIIHGFGYLLDVKDTSEFSGKFKDIGVSRWDTVYSCVRKSKIDLPADSLFTIDIQSHWGIWGTLVYSVNNSTLSELYHVFAWRTK